MNVRRVLYRLVSKKVVAVRPKDYNTDWDDSIKDAQALFKEAEVMYLINVEKD